MNNNLEIVIKDNKIVEPDRDTFIHNLIDSSFGYIKEYEYIKKDGKEYLVKKDYHNQELTDDKLLSSYVVADNIRSKKYLITAASETAIDYPDHFKTESVDIQPDMHILNRLLALYIRKMKFIPTNSLPKLRDVLSPIYKEKMVTENRINKIFNSTGITFTKLFEFIREMTPEEFNDLIGRH